MIRTVHHIRQGQCLLEERDGPVRIVKILHGQQGCIGKHPGQIRLGQAAFSQHNRI